MRVQLINTCAWLVPVETFLYLPKENRFFYIDYKDITEEEIIFYCEKDILNAERLTFDHNQHVKILAEYTIKQSELMKKLFNNSEKKSELEELFNNSEKYE